MVLLPESTGGADGNEVRRSNIGPESIVDFCSIGPKPPRPDGFSILENQPAIFRQPAIEMYFELEGAETVVGHHEQAMLSIEPRRHLADERVEFFVPGFGHVEAVVIEHVLDAVEVVENARQHAFLKLSEQVEKDSLATLEDQVAQRDELVVTDAIFLESRRVLRPAEGQVRANVFPK